MEFPPQTCLSMAGRGALRKIPNLQTEAAGRANEHRVSAWFPACLRAWAQELLLRDQQVAVCQAQYGPQLGPSAC